MSGGSRMHRMTALGPAFLGILATAATARADEPASARVRVHVNTPEPVVLERRDEGTPWQDVCTSPCDADVPLEGRYRINGDGVHKSRTFHLEPSANGQVTLDVDPGASFGHTAGVIMIIGGIPATAVGAIVLVAGLLPQGGDLAGAGALMFFGGAAITVGGAVLIGSNRTSVGQVGQTALAVPAGGRGAVLPARGAGVPIVRWAF
jgi:hypothetical protein